MESLLHIHLLDSGGIIEQFIKWIINNGGLYFLLFIVFAETGLFIGFFLPGDSLLFAAGIFLDQLGDEFFGMPFMVVLMVCVASIIGNQVGYWFGRKTGPMIYQRKESWLFRK